MTSCVVLFVCEVNDVEGSLCVLDFVLWRDDDEDGDNFDIAVAVAVAVGMSMGVLFSEPVL